MDADQASGQHGNIVERYGGEPDICAQSSGHLHGATDRQQWLCFECTSFGNNHGDSAAGTDGDPWPEPNLAAKLAGDAEWIGHRPAVVAADLPLDVDHQADGERNGSVEHYGGESDFDSGPSGHLRRTAHRE